MRILQVVCGLARNLGGPSVAAVASAVRMRAAGHDCRLLCTDQGVEDLGRDGLDNVPPEVPCEVLSYSRASGRLYRVPKLKQRLDAVTPQPEIVHLHGLYSLFASDTAAWCRDREIPYLLRPCGALSAGRGSLTKQLYHLLFDRRLLRDAARVHFTSAWERERSAWAGVGEKALVCPPPTDWPPPLDSLPAKRFSPKPYFAFLGRCRHLKGFDLLLDSCTLLGVKGLGGRELLVAGPADERARRKTVEAVRRGAPVRLVGELSGADKWRFLRDAERLVLPSRHENFGLVCIEALAVGTPLLLSRNVGAAADLERLGAALVFELSPDTPAMVAALAELLRSAATTTEKETKKQDAAEVRAAAARYHPEKTTAELLRVYEEILRSGKK